VNSRRSHLVPRSRDTTLHELQTHADHELSTLGVSIIYAVAEGGGK
jgi:hypothetical protein